MAASDGKGANDNGRILVADQRNKSVCIALMHDNKADGTHGKGVLHSNKVRR